MSLLNTRKCCCTDCGTCSDCFTTDADSACCRLHPKDKLVLKIDRPAWSMPIARIIENQQGSGCTCGTPGNGERITGATAYAAAQPIMVGYEHFVPDSDSCGYSWFADNGSFGCRGGTDENTTTSTANNARNVLWGLWPPKCPQPNNGKPACCDIPCSCTTNRTYGPSTQYPGSAAGDVCGSNNTNLTQFQAEIINGNPADRTYSPYHTCGNGSVNAGNSVDAKALCEYYGYEWLEGIYDDPLNTSSNGYHHYYWNGTTVVQKLDNAGNPALLPLAFTLVSVYHKEKWYKACEKYDGSISSCDEVSPWGCRVPEYFIYGCAGVPVFSWELKEMLDAGKITESEYEHFFRTQAQNTPLASDVPGSVDGQSFISKLESKHWLHPDSSGIGILQLKDWAGTTLPNTSTPVPNTERRVVRKDLASYDNQGNRTVVEHKFFHGRSGGWTHACRNIPNVCGSGACLGTILPPFSIEGLAPQVARETGCKAQGGDCDFQSWEQDGDQPIRKIQRCFTASPFPQCGTCVASDSCGGCTVCTDCTDVGCSYGQMTACGGDTNGSICGQDRFKAECDSIHFTFTITFANQLPPFENEECVRTNHAWLFAVNENCEKNATVPQTCIDGDCPSGPVTDTPARDSYFLSRLTSLYDMCGDISKNTICDGARRLLYDQASGWQCSGILAKRIPNPDPESDPGTAMHGPFTDRGCGQYLCNDWKNVLGACCVTETATSTTECIDAVTAEQCTSCGNQPGFESEWHGKDSCCGTNDDLC